MTNTFLIIDDDINIRKMLKHLLIKNQLGKVLEELNTGKDAAEEIVFYQPDIVLIDFLLPFQDGTEIIESARNLGYQGKFIMISQVEDPEMIAKAYENDIVFFIHKPINIIEAINVIKGVCRNVELEKSVNLIKNAVFQIDHTQASLSTQPNLQEQMLKIFSDIGIISESGCNNLIHLIEKIILLKRKKQPHYQLQDLYRQLATEENLRKSTHINARTIEQRIRRIILKALENIASLGNDDYYNTKFTEYSTILFDFKQVKQEIRYIDHSSKERGKINIKKFIEGILSKLNF